MEAPRRPIRLIGAVIAAAALALGLALTQPWLLLLDERVSEAVPVAAAGRSSAPTGAAPTTGGTTETAPTAPPEPASPAPGPATPAAPVELARGELVSHEHTTTGTARLLDRGDGTRVLRLEGLDTSNGPDLRVWLTDADVLEGRDGWRVFDDGAYVDLGPLEGNQGDANYEIPPGTDLGALRSVSVWCARFRVSFGAAELE